MISEHVKNIKGETDKGLKTNYSKTYDLCARTT